MPIYFLKMSHRNRLILLACLCSLVFLGIYLFNASSSGSVSIATTVDAFVSPDPRIPMVQIQNNKTILKLGATPAPWPEEANLIYRSAKSGKTVHIFLRDSKPALNFDISGMTDDGYFKVICESEEQAKKIIMALGLGK